MNLYDYTKQGEVFFSFFLLLIFGRGCGLPRSFFEPLTTLYSTRFLFWPSSHFERCFDSRVVCVYLPGRGLKNLYFELWLFAHVWAFRLFASFYFSGVLVTFLSIAIPFWLLSSVQTIGFFYLKSGILLYPLEQTKNKQTFKTNPECTSLSQNLSTL